MAKTQMTMVTTDPREPELRARIQRLAHELQRIVTAHEKKAAAPIVGKCFKIRNADSQKRWWTHVRVLKHQHGNRFIVLYVDPPAGAVRLDRGAP